MTKAEDTGLLWAGEFGDEYIKRNSNLPDRSQFWNLIMHRYKPKSFLEVGCNIGHNLRYVKAARPNIDLAGCDVNDQAIAILRAQHPGIWVDSGDIRALPYDNRMFDMVACVGVLIHITNDVDLADAVYELFRVSERYVLIAEYYHDHWQMVDYHGYDNALRKGPFDKFIERLVPEATLWGSGPLDEHLGFDWGLHYWVYRVS
jgi:SAM-dependent methyltransferase